MKRDHILYIIIALFVLSTMLFPSKCYAENKTITFTWEQEISPDFAGWELYYSKDPNASFVLLKDIKYTEGQNTFEESVILDERGWIYLWFKMLSYDISNLKSDWSNTVSDRIYFNPLAPFELKLLIETSN